MKNLDVSFYCIGINDEELEFELHQERGKETYSVSGQGLVKSKMISGRVLPEAIEVIFSHLRNLRAIKLLQGLSNYEVLKLVEETNTGSLPDTYRSLVNQIQEKIQLREREFLVEGNCVGKGAMSGNTIYFDEVFNQDVESLRSSVRITN